MTTMMLHGVVTKIEDMGTVSVVHMNIEETGDAVVAEECFPDVERMGLQVGHRVSVQEVESHEFREDGRLSAMYSVITVLGQGCPLCKGTLAMPVAPGRELDPDYFTPCECQREDVGSR